MLLLGDNITTQLLKKALTISIIASCSSGIEPLYSLAFFRNILDVKRLLEVNSQFEAAAKRGEFYSNTLIDGVAETGSIQSIKDIPDDVRRVFVTAHDIAPDWHVRMQAAFQKHCDAAISKTINLPHGTEDDDVRKTYLLAYDLGCKGVTVYRDGCRQNQPMALVQKNRAMHDTVSVAKPVDLPAIMPAVRVRQMTPFGNMHVKIVVDPQTKQEREIFAQLGKGGDLANSDLEAICRVSSLYLRVGGTLHDLFSQLGGIESSFSIPTKDGRITSLADGLAKAIARYCHARDAHGIDALLLGKSEIAPEQLQFNGMLTSPLLHNFSAYEGFKIKCPQPGCTAHLVFQEGCAKCLLCGFTVC